MDEKNRTALHYACEGGYSDIVSLFSKKMAISDMSIKDSNDETPFSLAAKNNHNSLLEMLVRDLDLRRESAGKSNTHISVNRDELETIASTLMISNTNRPRHFICSFSLWFQ